MTLHPVEQRDLLRSLSLAKTLVERSGAMASLVMAAGFFLYGMKNEGFMSVAFSLAWCFSVGFSYGSIKREIQSP